MEPDARRDLEAHWHRFGFERAVACSERFCQLVRGLDVDQLQTPVPGLEWTVVDVVAHVASVFRRYTVDSRRAAERLDVATYNAEDLAAVGRDVPALLEALSEQLERLEGVIPLVEPSTRFPFHAGQTLTLAGGWGNMIGELLAHGQDIAGATGAEWSLDDTDLEPTWRYTARVLPGWFTDEGRTASDQWELHMGFASGPVQLRFTSGGLEIDSGGAWVPDHTIVGAAAVTTLSVPYGRRAPADDGLRMLAGRFEPL